MVLLEEIIYFIRSILWGPVLLVLLAGTGLFLTLRLKGIQILKFPRAVAYLMQGIRRKDDSADKTGDILPFQALLTSLAAIVGNGNIAGVATAIAVGGPGAVFWMWLTALLGMATKFSEVVLGVIYRSKNPDNTILGGPMLYLRGAFRWKRVGTILAGLFAFALGMKTLISSSMVQSNSIAVAVEALINTNFGYKGFFIRITIGIIITVLTWIVIVGGVKGIARVSQVITPVMAFIYISSGAVILALFWRGIPSVLGMIFSQAFTSTAAIGGFSGSTVMMALQYGMARGTYSNEAGLGSAAVVHAAAKTDKPIRQGLISLFDVFIDTIVICSISAFAILLTGQWSSGATSTALVTDAFTIAIPHIGGWIVVLSSLLFGYSTTISYPYFGEQAMSYLLGFWVKKYYRWVFCVFMLIGSILKVNIVWLVADILIGLMALPNLLGLIMLNKVVVNETKIFFNNTHK